MGLFFCFKNSMLSYQSSQTNKNAANYQGSQTYNFKPVASSPVYKAPVNKQGLPSLNTGGSILGLATQSGGGGGGGGSTQTTTTTGGSSGGDNGDGGRDFAAEFAQALSDYYSPAFSRLDSLEQNYNQQLPISQQQLETSYGEAMQPINERLASGNANIQAQRGEVEAGKTSAISQARQLYNELSQRGLSRFGAGTSTGDAYSEIIGRQTAQNMGSAEQAAGVATGKLDTEYKNLGDFVAQQKITLGQKKQSALDQLKADFDSKIREINGQRGQLEQSKAEQRIAELQNARQRAYEIEDADKAFQRQLDLFNEEKKGQLSQQYSVNGGISTQAINAFKSLAPVVGTVAAAKLAGVDLSQVAGTIRPQSSQWKPLGDGRYINTETGELSLDPTQDSMMSVAQGVTGQ